MFDYLLPARRSPPRGGLTVVYLTFDLRQTVEPVERPDRWTLPYHGMAVTQLRVDAGLTLVLDDVARVTVTAVATLLDRVGGSHAGGNVEALPVRLAPHRQQVGPALELVGARVVGAAAFKDGRLWLRFDGGAQLHVRPDARREAWRAAGPGSLRLVCLAGGGLAVWR